jgi:hypothetical protein
MASSTSLLTPSLASDLTIEDLMSQQDPEEITIKLTDKEYHHYLKKGQSEYRMRIKKAIEDEDYVKWMFMRGEY